MDEIIFILNEAHSLDIFGLAQTFLEEKVENIKVNNICNEHLINGGDLLLFYLTMLFDYMYCFVYVPLAVKRGIILTLYKGGHKPKNQCNSYRAKTLSSSVLKLYENVLLNRLQNSIDLPIHSMQGGFQPNVSCAMTSFILNESINFCREKTVSFMSVS